MADRIKNYQQAADELTILKDIRSDLAVTPSSYTPDTSTVTRDRVATFAQAEEANVVLGDIQTGMKQFVADTKFGIGANAGDIANIKALLQGHLYNYQTDSTAAYVKTVPAGALPYAGIEQIGGKTVVWNQLVDSGTTSVATISGRKYYTLIDGTASIVTADGTAITIVDDTADMVCDLTLMFGSGNEPSTVEEFEAMFPADYYAYNEGELLSAGVIEVVSKDSNNATLQTYSIPTAIRNLEGYGWSAGSVYNEIDFERKVFIKRVGRKIYDGTETWNVEGSYNFYSSSGRGGGDKIGSEKMVCSYCVCDASMSGTSTDTSKFPVCFISVSGNLNMLRADITHTGADMQAWCLAQYNAGTPLTVYYELATPVEIDISQYLTDDNLIQVEAGGTLTFPNSNGTDYQIPVPSEVMYMIDLQEAINNG